jgi:Domain of unknown function (DUF4340)
MRGVWSTIVLVLVLAGLVSYIYFVDSKRDPSSTTAKEKPFTSVQADDIEEVQIKSADGETTRMQKADGKWEVVEPVKAAADTSEATTIASSLTSLEIQRVVDENASDLKQYGLEPARTEIAFRPKGQKDLKHLQIGAKTPTGSDLYARFPDQKRVFLVSSYLDSTFNKNTFALRDRRILVFDRNMVDGLDLTSGTSKTSLVKSGSEWRLASPLSVRADFAAVEGALERLSSTQMQGIVDAEGKDLAKYGLTKPTGTIAVKTGSSSAMLTLGSTDNALLFAKDSSRPMVFTIAPVLKDDVIRTVNDLRRKDLFDGRGFTATRAELKRGAETIVLEKSKGKDNMDVWKSSGKDVDAAKVDDLLTKVTGLRAASFEDKPHPSLKTPALVVTVAFGENKQETVTFGRSDTDIFASRSDEPGTAKVEGAGLDDVMKAIDALK